MNRRVIDLRAQAIAHGALRVNHQPVESSLEALCFGVQILSVVNTAKPPSQSRNLIKETCHQR